MHSVPRDVTLPSLDTYGVLRASQLAAEVVKAYLGIPNVVLNFLTFRALLAGITICCLQQLAAFIL